VTINEVFNSQSGMLISIEVANKLCNETILNVNYHATISKEMIEDGREKRIEKMSQLRSEAIRTIEIRNNKVNKLYEKLERFGTDQDPENISQFYNYV
jgi:hypothetical protein